MPLLPETLQTQINQHLKQETSLDGWVFPGNFIKAREGEIYKTEHPDFQGAVAVKCYYKEFSARLNKESLSYYSQRMNQKGVKYTVPQYYGCQENLLFMEWVEAQTLNEQLWQKFYHRDFQQALMRRSMRWLWHFHQQGSMQDEKVDGAYYQDALSTVLNAYQGYGLGLIQKNGHFQQAVDCLLAICRDFDGLPVPYGHIHGDFTPTNILLTETRVIGIDLGNKEYRPLAHDLAKILAHISISYPNMLIAEDMKSSAPYHEWPLVSLLLNAYGYELRDAGQQRFFLFVYLYQLARRWLLTAAKREGLVHKNTHTLKNRLLNRWILFKAEQISRHLIQLLKTM